MEFNRWLKDNGAILDKIEFPAVFGEGLQGVHLL